MTGQPSDPAVTSSYDARGNAKTTLVFVIILGFLTLPLVQVLVSVALRPSQVHGARQWLELALLAAPLVLLFGSIWYWVLSAVQRLELTVDTLRWRTLLRRHEVPLTELRRVRPKGRNGGAEVIEFARRRPVRVAVRAGLAEFAADIKAAAPQVEVMLADRPVGNRPVT
jgi:hypothetical protein